MRAAVLLGLAACGDPGAVIAPVIELPALGSQADPTPLDEVELSVARAGAPGSIVLATFARDEALVLDGVPFEDDLVVHLVGRRSGADVAYGRTCAFDLPATGEPPSPHLWFSRTVHWGGAFADPVGVRTGGQAWTDDDGALVVALGESGGGAVTEVDRFDAATGVWTVVTEVSERLGGVVAALDDGRAVLVGGRDGDGQPHARIEIVDPDPFLDPTDRLELVVDARLGVDGTAAATLASGAVVVIGGRDDAGPLGTVWILRPAEVALDPPRQLDTAALATPRSAHTLTRLGSEIGAPVLVVGGLDAAGAPVAAAELYRPLDEAFSATFAAAMVFPRRQHLAALLPDGTVLVIGGLDAAGAAIRTMERFSLDGGFATAGELPAGAGLVEASLTTLPDGRLLLSGGRTSATGLAVRGTYVIGVDPFDGSIDVTTTDELERPRAAHVSAPLCDGTVLTIGGDAEPTAERYQPPATDRR